MTTEPHSTDENTLHALVDGRLPPHEAASVRARVAEDPALQATVDAWQAQRAQLQGLYANLAEPAPSASHRKAAESVQALHEWQTTWWRLGGMAMSVVVAFGLGWAMHGALGPSLATGAHRSALVQVSDLPQRFAAQAAVAHAVYQPEQRHPVEVAAAQQEHLVQWLSKRLGRPLKVPDLQAEGYSLVGGRLLPGDSGARAQFMYQDAAGARVTLYLGAIAQPEGDAARETAFRFQGDGPVPSFYWVDQGFGYALSGALPREALMALATAVYRQL